MSIYDVFSGGNRPFDKEEWAAAKQAQRKEAYELIDNTCSEMMASGDSFRQYLDVQGRFDRYSVAIAESDNLVIYGHHIKGGKMFGALEDYKSKSFYEEHKNIQFDTLTEQAEYEIVAVFKTVAYSSEGFRYYDFVDAENEEDFNSYIGKCKELALYDTGVTAGYGDRLITLSTCEYSAQNGRLVVVAKKVG
jgi:sortase B